MQQDTFSDLLNSLADAPWDTAVRTFGNDHATLIGLLVHWWISGSPKTRSALEGGPSFGYHERGRGGGQCDAILCENGEAVGILEVEGTRTSHTVDKIGHFFQAEYPALRPLRFAILLVYACQPTGRGEARRLPPALDEEILNKVIEVSAKYRDKAVIVVTLDKVYERERQGIRARNEYYVGRPSRVTGILYEKGHEVAQENYWSLAREET